MHASDVTRITGSLPTHISRGIQYRADRTDTYVLVHNSSHVDQPEIHRTSQRNKPVPCTYESSVIDNTKAEVQD